METPVAVTKSTKLVPLILGGVVLLGAIGAYFYFKKPAVVAGTGAGSLPNGAAIKNASSPTTYLIKNGKKYTVSTQAEFIKLTGVHTENSNGGKGVMVVSQAVLDSYPTTTTVYS